MALGSPPCSPHPVVGAGRGAGIATGYKLTKPKSSSSAAKQGVDAFIPFVVTVVAILFTDLLEGIIIGIVVGFVFVIARNFRTAITCLRWRRSPVRARRNPASSTNMNCRSRRPRAREHAGAGIDLFRPAVVDLDNIGYHQRAFIKGAAPSRHHGQLARGHRRVSAPR